ncbi:hypothetical protein [Pseudonocardia sp. HH130630-07]|uniref:hypothetical protein n=1 Tax=Pseudonocardia sp. HH130630-07 TaxID=1690815 RepID=UPI000814CCE2|nr:hypothetical protein [Pseudonocardia sp. HH130630-07]ANY05572.1 hypothetical protein AFB00_03790 [Pseudonocardia sp. HH130630-07]
MSWIGLVVWGFGRAARGPVFWATTSFVLSQTVYVPAIGRALAELTRSPYSCNQFMNVWGLLSAFAVLACVVERNRIHWAFFGGAAALCTAALFVLAAVENPSPVGCIASLDVTWTSGYWWILTVVHVVSSAWAAAEIARHAVVAWGTPDRLFAAGLTVFGAAFVSSTVFWLLLGAVQVTGDRGIGASASAVVFPTTVYATSVALVTAATAQVLTLRTARRTLTALYRRHVEQERRLRPGTAPQAWRAVAGAWWQAPDEAVHRLSVRVSDNDLAAGVSGTPATPGDRHGA